MPLIAWSWSRLDTFEKCPLQFYHKNVIKSVPFEQNAAQLRGERIHKTLENAVKENKPLCEETRHLTPLITKLTKMQWDDVIIEAEHAYDVHKRKVSWFAKNAWVRIKQDFLARKGDTAVALDWKTGKNYGYSDQLKLYAAEAMMLWPDVKKVKTSFIYVDQNQKEEKLFTRDDYESIWQEFGERAERIQIASEAGEWPTKPSTFNCKWCPVVECKQRK